MQNFLKRNFNGNSIHILMWNNKPCLLGGEFLSILGFKNPSKTIQYYLNSESFETNIEYAVLRNDDLKIFKELANQAYPNLINSKSRNLLILYENGVYGILQKTSKSIGVNFRKWIRSEILPLMKTLSSSYNNEKKTIPPSMNKNDSIDYTNIEQITHTNLLKFESALKHLDLVNEFFDNSLTCTEKKAIIESIYNILDVNLKFK